MASIADYEDEIESVPAGGGSNKDLKNLPDGKYEFGITKAEFKSIQSTGSECVDLEIEVLTDGKFAGRKFQHTYWLTNKNDGGINEVSFGILKKDLKTLGFDEPEWKKANGRPWLGELTKALGMMGSGMQFHGKKATNKSGYAQLYIEERSKTDGKPAAIGKAELDAAADKGFNADATDY